MDTRAQHLLHEAMARGEDVPASLQPFTTSTHEPATTANHAARADFVRWLTASGPGDPPGVGRYLAAIWRERADLQETFPGLHLDPEAPARFLLWAHHFAAAECDAPPELIPAAPPGVTDLVAPPWVGHPPAHTTGSLVVGYLKSVLGLGEAARQLFHALQSAGENVCALSYDHTHSPLTFPWPASYQPSHTENPDVLFLAVNGTETNRLSRALGQRRTVGAYRIGLWFWELEQLTSEMTDGLQHLDEVWVTSAFVADAIRSAAPANFPVHVIPLGMRRHNNVSNNVDIDVVKRPETRRLLALPDGVLIGTTFDYASRIARKNPLGLIEAYCAAFPHGGVGPNRPVLVLKTLNAERLAADAQLVRAACGQRNDIVVIDDNYTPAQQSAYISSLNIAVSLHRSEGYGLFPLEAMAQGIPTIASGYSGNLAFMREQNSWLVPCGRSFVPSHTDPYPAGYTWGEPDLGAASTILHNVYLMIVNNDPELNRRTQQAIADTAALISGEAAATFAKQRLTEIRSGRR
jgi:glycosyltransferase involved in cell wall biosynthesis